MWVFLLYLASPYRVYPPVTQKLARLWTQYCEAIMKVNYIVDLSVHCCLFERTAANAILHRLGGTDAAH